MFREGYSEAQLEEMNKALIGLVTLHYCDYKKCKEWVLKAKTTFFQPENELFETAKRMIEQSLDLSPKYGFDYFTTQKDTIEKRKTFKYRDGYAYLDEYEFVGRVEIISCEMHAEYIGSDEVSTSTYVMRVIVKNSDRIKDFSEALYDHFSGSSCTHEHDCCGCWSYRVRKVKHIKLGVVSLFKVVVGGSRNY